MKQPVYRPTRLRKPAWPPSKFWNFAKTPCPPKHWLTAAALAGVVVVADPAVVVEPQLPTVPAALALHLLQVRPTNFLAAFKRLPFRTTP
jgi:hypothetical protein